MMLDKMQIEKIINLNNQLNEDIGKLQIKNDVLLVKNNLLQKENEKLKADLRGKENEINDIKERIAYLKRFKPKEKDIPIRQG
jgi:regulator of replication initiation timing